MAKVVRCTFYAFDYNKEIDFFKEVYHPVRPSEFLQFHVGLGKSEDWLFNKVMLYWLLGDLEKCFIG